MRTWLVACAALLLSACDRSHGTAVKTLAWEEVPNSHAMGFRILANGNMRRVLVFGPGGELDTVGDHRLVISDIRDPYASIPGLFTVPLTRVAVLSTTHLSYFAALGSANAVVGCAHLTNVLDTLVLAGLPPAVREIGNAQGLDREQLIALSPEALWDYPFGRSGHGGRASTGVPGIAVTEYLEPHPLGRAEWLRFFGLFLGKEREADSMFQAIRTRYEAISSEALALPDKPGVIFGSAWQGQWFVPGARTYMASLIRDAGGEYSFKDLQGRENIAVDLETILDKARQARHLGAVLATNGPVDAQLLSDGDPRIAGLMALDQGGFYGNSAKSDLFGRALLEPDVVLRDLRCLFHPKHCDGYRPSYFFPLVQ